MSAELAIYTQNSAVATAADVKAHVDLVQRVMAKVMKPDTHYGTIPGTNKPTLYKAGSEVLLTTFRIAVDPEVDDLSDGDHVRYRVRCVGRHQTSGVVVGTGIGECSSAEEKYCWRDAVCQEEFDETPENRRRVKWQRGKGGSTYKRQQVRTNPADVANTVLKMAKKRAQIDLTLTATSASDIFAQDLEDVPEELREAAAEAPPRRQAPKARSGGARAITEKQLGLLLDRINGKDLTEAWVCEQLKIDALDALPFERMDEALELIASA